MRNVCLWVCTVFVCGLTTAQALTLTQAIQYALVQSESLKLNESDVQLLEAEYDRRFSVAYPTLTFLASELVQDVPSGSSGGGIVQDTFVRRYTPDVSMQLRYTVFSGLREFAALRATKHATEQSRARLAWAKQGVMADVARAFYTALQKRGEVELFQHSEKVLMDRIDELRRFERLGRSRPAERISLQAELKRLETQRLLGDSDYQVLLSVLQFLTGLEQIEPLEGNLNSLPPRLSDAELGTSAKERPDLVAIRWSVKEAHEQIRISRADFFPTADLRGNYYLYRVGFRANIDWDVGLFLTWPLFEGFRTRSELRQARLQERQALLRLSLQERQVSQEMEQSRILFDKARERARVMAESVALYEKNYSVQTQDYRLRMVTTLEVLDALRSLTEARRDHVSLLAQTHVAYVGLLSAAGRMEVLK